MVAAMAEQETGTAPKGLQATRPVKRSFSLAGHRTSISLEAAFWDALREAAKAEGVPLAALVARIDQERGGAGLSGAVRVWVLDYFMRKAEGRMAPGTGAAGAENAGAATTAGTAIAGR